MTAAALLIAGYFGILAIFSVAARRYRARLMDLGNAMLADTINPQDRRFIEGMMSTAYAWRAAIGLFFIYLVGLFQPGAKLDEACEEFVTSKPEFANDERLHEMMDAYFASAVAVNPLFGLLAICAKHGFRFKARLHHNGKVADRMADFVGFKYAM